MEPRLSVPLPAALFGNVGGAVWGTAPPPLNAETLT